MARRSHGRGLSLGMLSRAHQRGPPMQLTRPPPDIFCKSYRCHSMACLDRPGLEFGDKIIMPQAAFQEAHRMRLKLPLLFKLVNTTRVSGADGPPPFQFCGVLEFSAPEDQVYLPYWLMQNLLLVEGARVELRSIRRPPTGSFVRLKPHDNTFLDVAARQGPKALMEAALRRYSVLSEGATILVQHEGDNFYLDVVEIETVESPATASNVPRANPSSPTPPLEAPHADGNDGKFGGNNDDEGESGCGITDSSVVVDDVGGGDGEARLGAGAGRRRVRLVSLLGDLDLEVEFCSPRAPLPRPPQPSSCSVSGEHDGGGGGGGGGGGDDDGGGASAESWETPRNPKTTVASTPGSSPSDGGPAAATADRSTSDHAALAEGGRSPWSGGSRLPLPLAASARARKICSSDGDVSAVAVAELQRGTGQVGANPPAPPTWKASSFSSKCQAFAGRGMALLGTTKTKAVPSIGGRTNATADVAAAKRIHHQQQESSSREVVASAASAARQIETREDGGRVTSIIAGVCRPGDGGGGRPGSFCGGDRVDVANRPSSSRGKDKEGVVGGMVLGEGVSVTAAAAAAVAAGAAAAAVSKESKAPYTKEIGRPGGAVGGDGKGRIVEAEQAAAGTSACGSCGRLVPTANMCLHELRCRSSVVAGKQQQQQQQQPQPRSHSFLESSAAAPEQTLSLAPPSADCTSKAAAAREAAAAAAAAPRGLACAYCGLTFRTPGAARDHREFCSTRTERCRRCLGHVLRSEAESHRSPGGGCDAAIAAAEQQEAQLLNSAAVGGESGGWGGPGAGAANGSGGGGIGYRGEGIGGMAIGGRFDALLAEAVRSSKEASAMLADACTKNEARQAEAAAETVSVAVAGSRAMLGSRHDGGCSGGGGGDSGCHARRGSTLGEPAAAPAPDDDDSSVTTSNVGGENDPFDGRFAVQSGEEEKEGDAGTGSVCHLDCRPWTCSRCTLINPYRSEACEACGSSAVPGAVRNFSEVSPRGGGERAETEKSFDDDRRLVFTTEMATMMTASTAATATAAARDHRSLRTGPPLVALSSLQPIAAISGSALTSVSAPHPSRPRNPVTNDSSSAAERACAGHVPLPQTQRTVPPTSPTFPAVVGAMPGVLAAAAAAVETAAAAGVAGAVGPIACSLASPVVFAPAEFRQPPSPRRRKTTMTLESTSAIQQRQQQQQQQQKGGDAKIAMRNEKPHKKQAYERRNRHASKIMGPPRRLGGTRRPSRLRYASPSLLLPPVDAGALEVPAAAAPPSSSLAFTPGANSPREATLVGHDGHHSRERHQGEQTRASSSSSSRRLFGGAGSGSRSGSGSGSSGSNGGGGVGGGTTTPDDARSSPPPVAAAPACDISLSVLGRGRGKRSSSGSRDALLRSRGQAVGGPRTGECSSLLRPGQERTWGAYYGRGRVLGDGSGGGGGADGGGVGAWGRRDGIGKRTGVGVGLGLGVAPLKLRRRASHTRFLEPLFAG
ncbi:unnamed protein product [Pylaiella littoralis]